MEELTAWVIERVAKMPRGHRFTVGDRFIETSLDVTAALMDASFTRDRRALLASASRGLTRLRLLARLSHRLGLILVRLQQAMRGEPRQARPRIDHSVGSARRGILASAFPGPGEPAAEGR